MADCPHCSNGYLGLGDIECVNGVLIDIDIAHEGWQRDVAYPAAPCQRCPHCCDGEVQNNEFDPVGDCAICNATGWKSGRNESQERLKEWAAPDAPAVEDSMASDLSDLKLQLLARIAYHHRARRDDDAEIMRECHDTLEALAAERDAAIAEAQREERSCLQTIDERDVAESALSQVFARIVGHFPEWSNRFGYPQAIEAIDEHMTSIEANADAAFQAGAEAMREAFKATIKKRRKAAADRIRRIENKPARERWAGDNRRDANYAEHECQQMEGVLRELSALPIPTREGGDA